MKELVNSWNEWDPLEEIVIGTATNACFCPKEIGFCYEINDPIFREEMEWMARPKSKHVINKANKQLDNLIDVLENNCETVVKRPIELKLNNEFKTPFFSIQNGNALTCPRDVMITIGDTILEATMSQRSRYFEFLAYRDIVLDLYKRDLSMKWISAPKPKMEDSSYNPEFWTKTNKELYEAFKNGKFNFNTNENEIFFDAADISRVGKDLFVQHSMTTNLSGINWLKRTFPDLNIHRLNFAEDTHPFHIDATFVPLRKDLLMLNPERPLSKEFTNYFKENDWDVFYADQPDNKHVGPFSQCSKWLSINILSVNPNLVIIEENEKRLKHMLEEKGIEVISLPFTDVYPFGGSFHCVSWDIRRNGKKESYFQKQPFNSTEIF